MTSPLSPVGTLLPTHLLVAIVFISSVVFLLYIFLKRKSANPPTPTHKRIPGMPAGAYPASKQHLEGREFSQHSADADTAHKENLEETIEALLRSNKFNKAGLLLERSRKFDQACHAFLQAKLPADAKRCCEKIAQISLAQTLEFARLFAEAGDKSWALELLLRVNDKSKLLSLTRETKAYSELARALEKPAARELLLASITTWDFEQMLTQLSPEQNGTFEQILLWLNESRKGAWLIPAFLFMTDRRATAMQWAEKFNAELLENYIDVIQQSDAAYVEKNRKAAEWTARALHDAGHWRAAAHTYVKLNAVVLAGKCWALCGERELALNALASESGDHHLANLLRSQFANTTNRAQESVEATTTDQENLLRIFFNIDPDTEKNRIESPFSIAS